MPTPTTPPIPTTGHSILLPFLPRRPEQVLPYAALVQWTGATRLWQGQSGLVDAGHGFAAAAGAGFRVPTGLGVTLMPLQHPYQAAHQVRSLAMTTGQPVVAGFGPGGRSLQERLLGTPYPRVLTAAREYVTIVRGLLAGEEVDVDGDTYCCRAQLPAAVAPAVELGLGVLRSRMARLAGEVADVAITWLTPAHHLRDQLGPAMAASAAMAGRAAPRLAAMVPVALHRPDRDPADAVLAGCGAHLAAPHYVDMLRGAGIDVTGGEDPALDAKRVIEGGAFVTGDLDAVLHQLAQFRAAGVDEIILNLTGVFLTSGPRAAMDDLKVLLAALDRTVGREQRP